MGALGTENNRPSSAAQCVAYVAVAELPSNLWPELIPVLANNVASPTSTEMMKEATLEAIGYICQEIVSSFTGLYDIYLSSSHFLVSQQDQEVLQAQSNQILTAIIHGMRQNEPSNHVRLAATTALLNSLEFTRANFEMEVGFQ